MQSVELENAERYMREENTDTSLCARLEAGDILIVPQTPYLPAEDDLEFLRVQKQSASSAHKNIAYKPNVQRVSGAEQADAAAAARMQRILAAYSDGALRFLSNLLPRYAQQWKVDYASFRPVEEEGRDLPLRSRNDLLHLDAFPTRPTHGGRILRAFTNIHPTKDRVWITSDAFSVLAEQYARDAGLDRVVGAGPAARRAVSRVGRAIGIKVPDRSAYDEFMLGFHHYLKSNAAFQTNGRKHSFAFPPGSTWITFTDQVAHAVTSGQYALEQTCIVPYSAMLQPEIGPLAVLQRIAGRPLVAGPASAAGR